MSPANLWSRILIIAGSIAMLAGAADLMEGPIVILPGSALVALGTYLGHCNRRWVFYRLCVFILIAMGVGAMLGLTAASGIGDRVRYSPWWGLLMLPYLVGWTMGIWGPGSPRWLLALGILVGAFHLSLVTVLLQAEPQFLYVAVVLGVLGLVTIVGCILRWKAIVPAKPVGGQSA